MKKLAGFIVFIVLTYAIYNDLSIGTLPAMNSQNPDIKESEQKENIKKADRQRQPEIPYFEHEVKPGDTVLSVLDSISDSPLNVPVSQAVDDFKKLNDGTDPQKIKFGNTYKFPDYSSQN
ncbi:LysM peptidoglycan-binding domain-containing protein [Mesobacillus jeotgali]|uniref:LysM peptidoglycan-binding domain-containing protein n=1 Tax=Mesobacillus jeotgali TaxID=129985 RepID=UPI0009A8E347|nr:LysM domain-containing protein [Mesobacillus jeotgali]